MSGGTLEHAARAWKFQRLCFFPPRHQIAHLFPDRVRIARFQMQKGIDQNRLRLFGQKAVPVAEAQFFHGNKARARIREPEKSP